MDAAGGPIDDRVPALEHQIAHVRDVGALERHDRVAARVGDAMEPRANPLVADLFTPDVREGRVRIELLRRGRRTPGRRLHVFSGALVCDDLFGESLEDDVAVRVIGVMMRVDDPIDRPVLRSFVQTVEQQLRGIAVLRVDDRHAAGVDQVADRAATAREESHVASDRREDRSDRGRGLLPGAHEGRSAQRAGGGAENGSRDEVASGQGHRTRLKGSRPEGSKTSTRVACAWYSRHEAANPNSAGSSAVSRLSSLWPLGLCAFRTYLSTSSSFTIRTGPRFASRIGFSIFARSPTTTTANLSG